MLPYLLPTLLHFNPRSLAGATEQGGESQQTPGISIHAPLRERPGGQGLRNSTSNFNPRSLAGATASVN